MNLFCPKVSIVIPVYNGENYLKDAISSALAQTYNNTEVIVVNDGSNDNGATERIALSYGDRIRYFSKENGGVASALNMGIMNMRGDYFSWLSHDDVYLPEKIERQIAFLNEKCHPKTIIYCGVEIINELSEIIDRSCMRSLYPPEKLCVPLFPVFKNLINGCALLIHKSHFDRVGFFDVKLRATQDYALWFKMFRGSNVCYQPEVLIQSRVHSEQGTYTLANRVDECDELLIHMINEVTEDEMLQMEGSKLHFYRAETRRLGNTAYIKAWKYAKKLYKQEMATQLNPALSCIWQVQDILSSDKFIPRRAVGAIKRHGPLGVVRVFFRRMKAKRSS